MEPNPPYKKITIIANPVSKRNGAKIGYQLLDDLSKLMPNLEHIDVLLTNSKSHAKTLAHFATLISGDDSLIISVGGDGMYNEVINGVMMAKDHRHQPVVTVYKAGNANDHYQSLHRWNKKAFLAKVAVGQTQMIDLLKLVVTGDEKSYTQYAHSYIGLGFSADAAYWLNHDRPSNRFSEAISVSKALKGFEPIHIDSAYGNQKLASLSFHNSKRMAKYFKASSNGLFDDGKFEYIEINANRSPHFNLIKYALKAITKMAGQQPQTSSYRFKATRQCLIQLDGEEMPIDQDSLIEITIESKCLKTLL